MPAALRARAADVVAAEDIGPTAEASPTPAGAETDIVPCGDAQAGHAGNTSSPYVVVTSAPLAGTSGDPRVASGSGGAGGGIGGSRGGGGALRLDSGYNGGFSLDGARQLSAPHPISGRGAETLSRLATAAAPDRLMLAHYGGDGARYVVGGSRVQGLGFRVQGSGGLRV